MKFPSLSSIRATVALLLAAPFLSAQAVPKIMPLGDSITWGSHRTETIPGGYRRELAKLLTNAGHGFDFVGHGTGNPAAGIDPDHNGNPGIRTDQVLANLQTWMTVQPDLVLMKLGTNDMIQKVPVHVAAGNIRTLIHRITDNAPNRRLYVSTIVPINEARDGRTVAEWAPIVNAYNSEVRKLVAEHAAQGRKVILADAHAELVYTGPNPADNFFQPTDGTHPATAGYKQLGAYWFGKITAEDTLHDPPAEGYPNVPTGLTATIASASQVNLSWSDTSANETGFRIYRKTGSTGEWTLVETTPAGATSHAVTDLATDTTFYQFAVSATNGNGDSAWSLAAGTTPANVALNRPSSATTAYSGNVAAPKANDGDPNTLWAAASTDAVAAWSVDLGGSHLVHRVDVVFRQDSDQPMSRRGFEIQGSNDPAFSTYQVLGAQGSTELMHASTFFQEVSLVESFRHVRVRKTDGSYFALAEVKVYGSPAAPPTGPFTLTVASSPAEGIAIATSPPDINGEADGTTSFSRSYDSGTTVTLAAPVESGSRTFVKWQLHGADYSLAATITLNVTSDTSLTAVYEEINDSLVNGSFESGLTGWTAIGNLVVQTSASLIPPQGGSVVAFNDTNRTPGAELSQTFATVPGGTYTLAFGMGTISYNTLQQKLQVIVTGGGTLLAQDLTMNGQGNGVVQWTSRSFTFTANTPSTTLTFRDTSTATNAIDLLLDHVRVIVESLPNRPPVANGDSYQTPRGMTLAVTAPGVLANDTDSDTDSLSAILHTSPSHGSVALEADGSFTYTPAPEYSGSDTFSYHANDGTVDSEVVTVSLEIIPDPEPPAEPVSPSLTLDGSTVTVRVDEAAAGVHVLESSPDLENWEELEVKELEEAGSLEFEAIDTEGLSPLFFRVGRRG